MDTFGYNACVQEWADALFRFACKCTGNREEAQDIVQNCFAILWEKRNQVTIEKAKAFLFQLAYRKSVDHFRRIRKVRTGEAFPDQVVADIMPSTDLKRILNQALDLLDEKDRALVLLRDYEGYNYEEIAQITGLSASQVKVYLFRARKVLKEYLVSVKSVL